MSEPGQQQVYYLERHKPSYPVTWALLSICLVVFAAQLMVPGFESRVAIHGLLVSREPWTVITAAFAHAGLLHLGMNMLALLLVGRPLEALFGHMRFLVLYLVSALGGSALTLVWLTMLDLPDRQATYLGASGAIFGLFGTLVVLQFMKLIDASNLFLIVGLNLVISFTFPGIAWQAHVGGMLVGAGIGWAMARCLKRESNAGTMWSEIAILTAAMIGLTGWALWQLRL